MTIPQGLILYRAARHHQSTYPVNLKYRHYSNKISLPLENPKTDSYRERNFQRRSRIDITKAAKITKLTQSFELSIDLDNPKETHIMRYFSKLHHIKKLSVHVTRENRFREQFTEEAICLILRAFRTLKGLQQVYFNELNSLQKNFRTFKNLLLQRSLQKLILSPLECTQDVDDLTPFLRLSQAAQKRRHWPHLNYVRIGFESYEMYVEDYEARRNLPGLDSNLLKFLQDFRACESIYKFSNFHLLMSEEAGSNISQEECAAFGEIIKRGFPVTYASIHQGAHIESLFGAAQYAKHLKSLDLRLADFLSGNLDMGPLKQFPKLEEMSLMVNCEDDPLADTPEANFNYCSLQKMQTMTHLKYLSLYFDGNPSSVENLLRKALLQLTDLTSLKLEFPNMIAFEDRGRDYFAFEDRRMSWSWLKKVFEAIGKMKKLKEFALEFENFNFKGASGIFKTFCQALGNLTLLSSLELKIEEGEALKDKDMLALAGSLPKLVQMELLKVSLGSSTKFKSATFAVFMDSIVKNLRILEELDLNIHCSDVTKQSYQVIEEGIRGLKHLNTMKLEVGGKIVRGVDMKFLNNEVRRRMAGGIYAPGY